MPPPAPAVPTTMRGLVVEEDEPQEKGNSESSVDQPRPIMCRSATAPGSPHASVITPKALTPTIPMWSRNSSPFRKTHLRSQSSASSLSAPQMTRAHSSPGSETTGRVPAPWFGRPSSPLGTPGRRRSPLRKSVDEPYLSFGGQVDIGETISENSELDLTPMVTPRADGAPSSPVLSAHHTFPRSRRRPMSPFGQGLQPNFRATAPISILRTSSSSPALSASQFNEPYPLNSSFSSSSIPSTPTSFRSRSPSMSSLETIPDSPDAELEAENIAQLKAAADSENDSEGDEIVVVRRRGSIEVLGRPATMRDKRKRWSVCGAERRGDLDLETIWED